MTSARSMPTGTLDSVASGMGTPFSRNSRRERSPAGALPGPVVSTRTRTVGKSPVSTVVMRTPSASGATPCAKIAGAASKASASA